MNWLKATSVSTQPGWFEIMLTDLCVMADGATEEEMLNNLQRTLTFHYLEDKAQQATPFVSLLRDPSKPRPEWNPDVPTKVRKLTLAPEVSMALAAVLLRPSYSEPTVDLGNGYASAA